ncbi:hypothetical protein GGU11DRAFT_679953 [Lentinula aff. detonsa]|nr:hypothetical protein GGU11DRAFT_679953 [Lentinula aff. detonsa]
MAYAGAEETTKSWTFVGFEWVVRDVRKLRNFVEGFLSSEPVEGEDATSIEADDFDILKHSPVIGDGKFKLEIARTAPRNERNSALDKPSGLALYITPLMLDFAHPQYEMSATMMAGIKCQDDRAGERGARADWPFEVWHDWVFRQDNEVWECALPSLSALLENPRIGDTDSFVICVQIHCPVGPSLPAQPAVYYVPKDLLDGLEASLDNSNTGDVQFVCLERLAADPPPSPNLTPETSPVSRTRPPSSSSSISPFAPEMTARRRIIYAHSDILVHRSEYFATMLSSSFSENPVTTSGERKLFTVVVEEADFETIYWLLKYCYANWLLFKEVDDPRAAVEGVGRGWSAHWLHVRGGEWDWKTFPKHGPLDDHTAADSRSAASGESLDGRRSPTGKGKNPVSQTTHIRPPPSTSRMSTGTVSGTQKTPSSNPRVSPTAPSSSSASRRVGSTSSSIPLSMSTSSPVRPKHVPIPLAPAQPSNFPPAAHYPVSPHSQRPRGSSNVSASDPHMHPTPPPPPASALAMYQVAHRYAMPGLSALALEHMMSSITPASSFALLLATSAWDELKTLVEDYVVDKWEEVSVSEEFEVCCQEVAAGEWGPEGGMTLMALFRRLRSPTTIMYARS